MVGTGKAAGSGLSARPPPQAVTLTMGPPSPQASSQGHSGGDHINCPTPIPSPFL